ncbi:MAG: 1-acyl-sn-glycerol-3-phosphate acyltransferase [Deltaproteobacteria bacterium]|nr:MAG: 1-acyl-sn-glycerol-3-phosphate acyltransferase [Deltaproteobacteria bacterium]
MLDLARLERIRLHRRPPGQILVGELALRFDYRLPRPTRITLEGVENIPRNTGVFFAMNHTDRYNYWPFQYQMYRHGGLRFTATWVKGKYYENRLIGAFMDSTNNIPLPSRGYVMTTEFRKAVGAVPSKDEYRVLRDLVDGRVSVDEAASRGGARVARLLGHDGPRERFGERFEALFARMMVEVARLTREALERYQLNVLVFPQGTRSKRLPKGHTGLVQMAEHLGRAIVPVGCNGSDHAYPGGSPFSKGGDIVYRIGKPLAIDGPELGPHRVTAPFVPFSADATRNHGDAFRAATDIVMDHINALLDPEYQYSDEKLSDGVEEMSRFV